MTDAMQAVGYRRVSHPALSCACRPGKVEQVSTAYPVRALL